MKYQTKKSFKKKKSTALVSQTVLSRFTIIRPEASNVWSVFSTGTVPLNKGHTVCRKKYVLHDALNSKKWLFPHITAEWDWKKESTNHRQALKTSCWLSELICGHGATADILPSSIIHHWSKRFSRLWIFSRSHEAADTKGIWSCA